MVTLHSKNAVIFDTSVDFYGDGNEADVKVIGWRDGKDVNLIVLELTDEGYIESIELPDSEQDFLLEEFERHSEKGL